MTEWRMKNGEWGNQNDLVGVELKWQNQKAEMLQWNGIEECSGEMGNQNTKL
jgi:hypothetical protein